ncbi:MAG: zinc-dependent dehydrogenase [Candidatus Atribacteria bacterium]|nr:zinc-dependent dehydrogenase [Candidatus Atribacteria bacterium]
MKAAFFLGPGQMEVREIEKPVAGEGEVVLQVAACAICGTDVRIFQYGHPKVKPPHTTGHEIAGEIVEVGKGVEGYRVGERVTVVTTISCGHCHYCRRGLQNLCPEQEYIGYHFPGGFAEYLKIPKAGVQKGNLLVLPEDMDLLEASLIEPLSCAINGQSYLHIGLGETVLVIGSGPIGCMHVELAKNHGAGKIVIADISSDRLELARRVGADYYINSQKQDLKKEVMAVTDGLGADVIIVAASAGSAQEQALDMVAPQGRISFFGGLPKDKPTITFNSNTVHYKEVGVFGVFASHASQYEEAAQLIYSGRIPAKSLITHVIPLEKIVEGISMVKEGKALKAVVSFQ